MIRAPMAHSFPLRLPFLGLIFGSLLFGCAPSNSTKSDERQQEIRRRWQTRISEISDVGPYRAATLTGEKGEWRLFFPRSGSCGELIRSGATQVYRFEGPFGVVVGEDRKVRCSPVGVGSLVGWRDQQPRRRSQFLVPREQARFSPMHTGSAQDPEYLLLRGSFPLALEIRWPEPMDSVALVPNTPECKALSRTSKTTMEFRAEGPEVFVLDAPGGSCPIVGLALPLGL